MGVVYQEVLKVEVFTDIVKNRYQVNFFIMKSDKTVEVFGFTYDDLVVLFNNFDFRKLIKP